MYGIARGIQKSPAKILASQQLKMAQNEAPRQEAVLHDGCRVMSDYNRFRGSPTYCEGEGEASRRPQTSLKGY